MCNENENVYFSITEIVNLFLSSVLRNRENYPVLFYYFFESYNLFHLYEKKYFKLPYNHKMSVLGQEGNLMFQKNFLNKVYENQNHDVFHLIQLNQFEQEIMTINCNVEEIINDKNYVKSILNLMKKGLFLDEKKNINYHIYNLPEEYNEVMKDFNLQYFDANLYEIIMHKWQSLPHYNEEKIINIQLKGKTVSKRKIKNIIKNHHNMNIKKLDVYFASEIINIMLMPNLNKNKTEQAHPFIQQIKKEIQTIINQKQFKENQTFIYQL